MLKRRRPTFAAASRALTSMRAVACLRRLRIARVSRSVRVPSLKVSVWRPALGLLEEGGSSGALPLARRIRPAAVSEHASPQRKRTERVFFLPSLTDALPARLTTGARVSRADGAVTAGELGSDGVVSAVSLRTAAATLPSRTRQSTVARPARPAARGTRPGPLGP